MLKFPSLLLFLLLTICSSIDSLANGSGSIHHIDTIYISAAEMQQHLNFTETDSTLTLKEKRKKKWVAAITAFPFPLGFMGAHRVMLGTKPWVPVAYVATFGGIFGLLPLVDFCVILFTDDIEQYENNPNMFMWVK